MRLDLDTYKEILDTITRNKSRSLLTGFGVFWGVFMLIALMGGGQGLKEILQNNFTGFATNTAIIWAQNTTKPYKGFNKGRSWQMEEKDLDRLRHQVPELDVITPLLFGGNKSVVFGDKKFSGSTQGGNPDYAQVSAPQMFYGRYINEMDVRPQRKVCVIGKQIYNEEVAHRVYAASDLFLMPSLFEPCGISQLISLRYGTLPLVRETGGLKDTVDAYNEYEKSGNGFSFEKYDSNDLINVLYYACDVYYNRKDDWQMLQTNAMNTDVSWENSANTYSLLYNELMNQ